MVEQGSIDLDEHQTDSSGQNERLMKRVQLGGEAVYLGKFRGAELLSQRLDKPRGHSILFLLLPPEGCISEAERGLYGWDQ